MLPTSLGWTPRERLFGAIAVINVLSLAYLSRPTPRLVHVDIALTNLHSVYTDHLADAKYIDLTHSIHPNMPVWDGFNQPTFSASPSSKTGKAYKYVPDGFIATQVTLPTDQLGTQLDPPSHWNEYGATISDLPPTVSLRPLVLIDISASVATDPGYHATVDDVKAWEAEYGRVPEGAAVLFRSDWSKDWDAYGSSSGPSSFPGVSLAALKFLHLERGILVHGHEPLDTDMTPTLEGEEWLLHNNFLQIEGATNLHLLPASGCLLSIGFPKIEGGSGGYARLVAVCPKEWPHGVSVKEAPAAPLPAHAAPLRRGADGVLVPTEGAVPYRYCAEGDGAWKEGCKKP